MKFCSGYLPSFNFSPKLVVNNLKNGVKKSLELLKFYTGLQNEIVVDGLRKILEALDCQMAENLDEPRKTY